MKVFGRKIQVVFEGPGGQSITPDGERLNIGFTIERNLDIEPSTAEVTLFNLRKDTQDQLKSAVKNTATGETWTIAVSAGYEDPELIFKGDIRFVRHRREPPMLATDVEADDGGEASTRWRTRHFPRGTTVGTVFRWMQEQSGLGAGNIGRITQVMDEKGLPTRLKNGTTVRGYIMEEMNSMARSAVAKKADGQEPDKGLIISSQGGEIVVLKPGEPLPNVPTTKISASTGLIGYPYVDNEGILTLNHRLLPNVFPGAPIEVDSEFVQGAYVVERAVYSGSLWDDDFNIEVEGRAVA